MATETEIINAALRKVGAKRISSAEDSVGSAGIASDVLSMEREELLRSANWNFATTRTNLAPLATEPEFEFDNAFALPSDCLRVISVHDNDAGTGQTRYKLESVLHDGSYVNCILADPDLLYLRYIRNEDDVSLFSSGFRQCLILRLARIFAISIAKSNSLYEQLGQELDRALRSARSVDGIEDTIDQVSAGSWVSSRFGYW